MLFGLDIENDEELFDLIYRALSTPLPKGWQKVAHKKTRDIMYIEEAEGTLQAYSPIDEAFMSAYEEMQEMRERQKKSEKVIPRTKHLPPIGSKADEKSQKPKKEASENSHKAHKTKQKDKNVKKSQQEKNKNKNVNTSQIVDENISICNILFLNYFK